MSTSRNNWRNFRQRDIPSEGGRYLVYLTTAENGDPWRGNNIEIAKYSSGIWISGAFSAAGFERFVSHWCELPEPPV